MESEKAVPSFALEVRENSFDSWKRRRARFYRKTNAITHGRHFVEAGLIVEYRVVDVNDSDTRHNP